MNWPDPLNGLATIEGEARHITAVLLNSHMVSLCKLLGPALGPAIRASPGTY